jgi:purine-binding chemotaxis protein CheW
MLQAPSSPDINNAEGINLVTIRLDRQRYALPVDSIVQIVAMVTITPLPHTLGSVLGVINVRGAAAPVIDLRCHMGMGDSRLRLYTPIVLTQINRRMVGLVVDEVLDVMRLLVDEIVPLDDIFPEGVTDLPVLQGMARVKDHLIPLLDVDRLFDPEMLKSLARSVDTLSARSMIRPELGDEMEPVGEIPALSAAGAAEPPNGQGSKSARRGRAASRRGTNGGASGLKQGA